jgi:predicted ATP-binding protein involved in virulence
MTNQPKKATTRRKPATLNNKIPPAYFLSLEVENFLCFKDKQKIDLSVNNNYPAQWTVILGNNGVGKTTLLRCLAGMEVNQEYIDEDNGFISLPALSYFLHDKSIWKELNTFESDLSMVKTNLFTGSNLSAIKRFENVEFQTHYSFGVFGDSLVGGTNELEGLICYGYGATRRTGTTSLSVKSSKHSESLFSDNANLINAEEWLLQTDYAVKSSSGQTRSRLKKQFEHIIEILKRVLPDIDDIRIAPVNKERERPIAEFLTPYGWVQLSSLGLGYRTTIAWMVDLAVRLFKRYPDSEDPLAEPAIVLVDEIDLHMHPKWQRDIMQFLTDRFPNTQFIVTAHSPLVVQAAQDANIVLLRREGDRVVIDNNPEIIENWRVDQVLTSVFEMPSARPAKIEPLLQRRKELLTKPKLTPSDRAELKELEAQIGTLPTAETSEDIKAMDIIRRAAKLLDRPVTEAVE